MKIKLLFSIMITIFVSSLAFSQNFYLGVGTDADIANQGTSCASCHNANGIASPKWNSWKNTLHGVAQDTAFSQSGSFQFTCLRCHTTGWDTNKLNYGADEYFVKDTTKKPNYTYNDLEGFKRTNNVQCEACHGPLGTQSKFLSNDHWDFSGVNKLDFQAELCGVCHTGSRHGNYDEWAVSKHAISLTAAGGLVTTNASCAKCHVAQNASAYLNGSFFTGPDKGQPYSDKIIVDKNNPDIAPVTCVVCHDPHGNGIEHQLRIATSSQMTVCDKCHTVEIDTVNINTTPHHTTSEALSGSKMFGYQYTAAELIAAGRDTVYQSSAHKFAATERCINCHLNDNGKNEFGSFSKGHTFEPRVPACETCHADYLAKVDTSNHAKQFDYRRTQTVTDSLMAVLKHKFDISTNADSSTDAFKKANYNYLAIVAEGSHGIHNTRLVQKLLGDAIATYTPTTVTGINIESNNLPASYTLSQNYPNPFNPSTEIKFSLPEASNVKLVIYDAIGKEVAVLVNDYLSTGSYRYSWNASNLASGIYFYRIEAKNFSMVKKMVLLK